VDAGCVVKAREGAGEEGFDAALLGRGEVGGEREGGEVVEGAADVLEVALDLGRARRDGGGARLRAQAAERVAQQLAAIGLVGDVKELDEPQGLGGGQPVALGAVEELVLVLVAELAQGAREGRADGAPGELALGGRRQAAADGQASFDPVGFVSQEPSDGYRSEPVLIDERADHLAFVEGGHGARRSVGLQQEPLVLRRRSRALEDDGHGARALLAPAAQALEAVEDFEGAVVFGRDSQRHLGQRLGKGLALARAQTGQAGAKPLDGQPADRPGDRRLGRVGCRHAGVAGDGRWLGHGAPVAAPRG